MPFVDISYALEVFAQYSSAFFDLCYFLVTCLLFNRVSIYPPGLLDASVCLNLCGFLICHCLLLRKASWDQEISSGILAQT